MHKQPKVVLDFRGTKFSILIGERQDRKPYSWEKTLKEAKNGGDNRAL